MYSGPCVYHQDLSCLLGHALVLRPLALMSDSDQPPFSSSSAITCSKTVAKSWTSTSSPYQTRSTISVTRCTAVPPRVFHHVGPWMPWAFSSRHRSPHSEYDHSPEHLRCSGSRKVFGVSAAGLAGAVPSNLTISAVTGCSPPGPVAPGRPA